MYSMLMLEGEIEGNLFDSCYYYMDSIKAKNNVYLKNYKSERFQYGDRNYWTSGGYLSGYLNGVCNNAILNMWWDPDVNHWMRFYSIGGRDTNNYLNNNYWGTTSKFLIDKAIVDYNDDFNRAKIVYDPILSTPPETAYPFVSDLYVSTPIEERTVKVGADTITVNVLFNRDMNTEVQPRVTFGPDMPTTDYTVHGVNGGWANPRHWKGEFNITPITGDGYQFFRVTRAQAVDDPWLVTGNDSERFRFEIITSGTLSMNLQSSGAEGKVDLQWTQDDFDTLAGYNLYRSETLDGTYEKINISIIPKDQKNYEDKNVMPGKMYYYKFKVVKTDLEESGFSNVTAVAPLDTIQPMLSHDSVNGAAPGLPLQIYANVTDNVEVKNVSLYYRQSGASIYIKKEMIKIIGDRYSVIIEGSKLNAPGFEYYIEATDGVSIVRNGSEDEPNKVIITDAPKITSVTPSEGSSNGGTPVVIMGTNFKTGAKVSFGETPAESVVVESSNKITTVTPAHFPALVGVTVTNLDGYKDTMVSSFIFKKEGVEVSIPNASTNKGSSFEVPVYISSVSGLNAVDLKLAYDSEILTAKEVRLGNITSNFSLAVNKDIAGQVVISMASAAQINSAGTLIYIKFEVNDTNKTLSPLTIAEIKLNSESIVTSTVDGIFTVSPTHTVSGSIHYYSNKNVVQGVDLTLSGENNYAAESNVSGNYTIQGIKDGDYTLKASKSNEAEGITAYDASLILQAAVGSLTLNDNQKIAADVNSDGVINATDASYVLKKSAGVISLPFENTKSIWAFTPQQRDYIGLKTDINGQNFIAILIGDVSGNWKGASEQSIQSIGSAEFVLGASRKNTDGTEYIPVKLNIFGGKLYGADTVVNYDKNQATALSVEKSEVAGNFTVVYNLSNPGQIKISMAGAEPITIGGELLRIKFEPIGSTTVTRAVSISKVEVNENALPSTSRIFVDANRDSSIDTSDIETISESYNSQEGNSNWKDDYDTNEDGIIDLFDLVKSSLYMH
jgi:hypothetical protein